jgi:hypothetical protein
MINISRTQIFNPTSSAFEHLPKKYDIRRNLLKMTPNCHNAPNDVENGSIAKF